MLTVADLAAVRELIREELERIEKARTVPRTMPSVELPTFRFKAPAPPMQAPRMSPIDPQS